MNLMQDQETDTINLINKPQNMKGRNTIQAAALPNLNDDVIPYDLQNMSDSSESDEEDNSLEKDPGDNTTTSMIEYLAISLVKRAN
jgi:hypothetical protein